MKRMKLMAALSMMTVIVMIPPGGAFRPLVMALSAMYRRFFAGTVSAAIKSAQATKAVV